MLHTIVLQPKVMPIPDHRFVACVQETWIGDGEEHSEDSLNRTYQYEREARNWALSQARDYAKRLREECPDVRILPLQ